MAPKTAVRRSAGTKGRGRGGRGRGRGAAADVSTTAAPQGGDEVELDEAVETPGSTEVLRGAAEAVASSLIDGAALEVVRLRQLRDALLAETADAGEDAALRCECLRRGFAKALRQTISTRPGTAPFTHGGPMPPARVEVRNTAGRAVLAEAFAVGRGPECDVQTSGDGTVSRLQFVAVPLPGGIIVIDAWSCSGTRAVRRFGEASSLPASVPGRRVAFMIPHGERVVFMIGSRTTVTLGPPASPELASPPVEAPVAVTPPSPVGVTTAKAAEVDHGIENPMVPEVKATLRNQEIPSPPEVSADVDMGPEIAMTPRKLEVPSPQERSADVDMGLENHVVPEVKVNPRKQELPSPSERPADIDMGHVAPVDKATPGNQEITSKQDQQIDTAIVEHAIASSAPDIVHSAAVVEHSKGNEEEAASRPSVAGRVRASAALSRCLAAVQAGVRMQQVVALRERLRWRCGAAKRARLITQEQCEELQDMLKPPADNGDEVADILDGLGVPLAPDDLQPSGTPSWECAVCRTSQRSRGWRCPFQHRCCRDCMLKWCEATPAPSCAHEGCGYRLGEHDLEDLRVPAARMDAFRASLLEQGLQALQETPLERQQSKVKLFRCTGIGCSAAVVLGANDDRRRFVCGCGAPPVCTGCGSWPYHYHGLCSDTQPLRSRWLAWLQGGREAYKGLEKRAMREATAQQRALKEAMARHTELEQDEQWKAENCRLCPKCKCPVQKVDGCNTIICGQNTHGGNRQPGCGHRFKWQDAPAYKESAAKARITSAPAVSRVGAISGRGVHHLFAQCGICNSGKCIVGPRFRCIHCPSFSCCLKCEPKLATEHEDGHVFEILFEDDIDWSGTDVVLPKGTRARIRRQTRGAGLMDDDEAAQSGGGGRKRRRQNSGLEGVVKGQKRGKYVLELVGGMGTRHVPAEDLQPLLTQKQAERLLDAASDGGGGAALRLRAEAHAR